jgi:RNA polymerase sigma-70 factor (ECF subfamily)
MTTFLQPTLPERHFPVSPSSETLDSLFKRVVEDDYAAFEQIFKRTYKMLCAYSCKVVKSREMAEEIVDDVFFGLWSNRKKIQITSSFQGYLSTAIRNRSLDWLRKLKHKRSTELQNAGVLICGQSIAHETLIYRELQAQIDHAIQELPRQCRTIFLMSRDQDLKYKEIAEILNISIKTVDTQMGRALKHLQKAISHE